MKTVLMASIVRDGSHYLDRYAVQVGRLSALLGEQGWKLRLALAENDSQDDTHRRLQMLASDHHGAAWDLSHGGPKFGSIDNAVRWGNIARTWNRLLDRVAGWQRQALIYVEADLIWTEGTMVRLLQHLDTVPAVAPMCWMGSIFYDIWGHRKDGVHFRNTPPFHPALVGHNGGLMQIDSAGSCIAMRGDVAQVARLNETEAMIGPSIYEQGHSLWLDPSLEVRHP